MGRAIGVLRILTAGLLLGSLGIQLVPTGSQANPPVRAEPAWDAPRTRELAVRACFDCHSNETVWPWYSRIAPVSWVIQREVAEGREELNFSEHGTDGQEGEDATETVLDGSMPPRGYLLLHPSARLSGSEQRELIAGLGATLGTEGRDGGTDDDERDDD